MGLNYKLPFLITYLNNFIFWSR